MLGRLGTDIDECIEKYISLSSVVFKRKKIVRNVRDIWKAKGAYNTEGLAFEFRSAAREIIGDEQALLRDANSPCKV